ncbi:MAG: DNA internalization-related competence protein ComEC/Rec2 [Candidatus Rokubacteria bacterium]|nr:DNA internalization-related competence protein ComEC/Rec2 [Candidatus Rokubacteria bacterium]
MRWHAFPLAPLAVAFVLGAIVPDGMPAFAVWVAWAICLALAAVLLGLGHERAATVTLVAAVAGLGMLRGAAPALPPHHLAAHPLPARARLEGRLAAEPIRWAPDRTRILLDADRLIEADEAWPVAGLIQLTLHGEPPPLTDGQRVAGDFRLSRPRSFRNPGGFDYAAHLARQDIFVVGSARADRVTALSADPPRWNVAAKRWADHTIQGALPPVSAALLDGLLFGERVGLPPEIDDAFRRAGVYHILAVSGFNVALLAASVFALLALLRIPRRAIAIVAIPVVAGFALVVGAEASVLRAAVMAILLLAAIAVEREPNLLNSLALAAIAILAARPGDLAEPGFQLSFGATLGIVLLARRLAAALAARGAPRWLADALAVSAGAQLVVTPIMLHHFNQLSLIGLVANLVVVPLAGVATLVGMLAVLASAVSDAVGRALFDGLWPVLLALRAAVFLAARVPAAMLHLPAPHWTAVIAFYGGIAALLAARTRWKIGGIALIAAAAAIEVWPIARPADGRLRVTFLDVGQGDAIVLELPDGQTALVDAGLGGPARFDVGERVVAPFLWNRGVRRLALAVVTHDDADHAGGLGAILRLFAVGEVWRSDAPPAERVRIIGGIGLMVLNPPVPPMTGSRRGPAADRNNNSLVLRLDHGRVSVLLTGDIEAEAERHLVAARAPLRARVLKVAHHGARASTGAGFLGAVQPAVAVISVGARNPFGHPAPRTLERLQTAGAAIYRTDEDGAVIMESDGRDLRVTRWADRSTRQIPLASR